MKQRTSSEADGELGDPLWAAQGDHDHFHITQPGILSSSLVVTMLFKPTDNSVMNTEWNRK
ncbi:hypothetical protein CONPUDRAFT_151128 [Coniophora puteana RWD-64-598 SS2]|uniref:Uncharacterized protein n=1 Tax=Coniophora puteana (strain RWD-64-598) TaxID=741705 RepID=A0A5M3MZM6_CONPW|nr:uncharacterized protein CONPUDRAFT_151128 [Coniophora puteana RWD-64-598 SS2]EIW84081.1 hypothetical protein CONPUDRAFT_151128 [Coniophora puteana RWD-64-598 SS2]